MSKSKFYEKENYMYEVDTTKWPTVLVDNIEGSTNQELFLRRKLAVDMYFNNNHMKEICEKTNFHRNSIQRYAKRCLELDENGNVFGYAALIPYKRVKTEYCRVDTEGVNNTGKFQQFLSSYPDIKEFIDNKYLGKSDGCDKNITPSQLYKKFIKQCHKHSIKESEYPFNTMDKGKRSLYRYLKSLSKNNYYQYTRRFGDGPSQRLKSTGIGQQNSICITRPFQRVEFDGHKIDAEITLDIKTPEGDIVTKTLKRIWLLAIIDTATRVILGYHLCLCEEYSSADVLKCIENAIKPKEKKNFTIPGLEYPKNIGFHSIVIPETKWAIWEEFLCDNAKANLANSVRDSLTRVVNCNINAGPVATPERRGLIERFFKTIANNGYQRLPSSVGNGINDPRKKNSEKYAIKYKISTWEIEELTEVLIAQYNNTPHSGINGFEPLELMKQRIERGEIPRIMNENDRSSTIFLGVRTKRKVLGNIKDGRRAYVYYEGVEYRSDILSKSPHLIGTNLTLLVDINDLRSLRAYLPDGKELGILTAKGKWSLRPHSLKERKAINKLKRDKKIDFNMYIDPIEVYQEYLNSKSIKNKSCRNKIATLNKRLSENSTKVSQNNKDNSKNTHKNKKDIRYNQLTKTDNDKIKSIENMFTALNK